MVIFREGERGIDLEVPQELEEQLREKPEGTKGYEFGMMTYRLEKPVTEISYSRGGEPREEFLEVLNKYFFVEQPGDPDTSTSIVISRFKHLPKIMAEEQMWPVRDGGPRHDVQGILFWPSENRGGCQDLLIDIAEFTKNNSDGQFK